MQFTYRHEETGLLRERHTLSHQVVKPVRVLEEREILTHCRLIDLNDTVSLRRLAALNDACSCHQTPPGWSRERARMLFILDLFCDESVKLIYYVVQGGFAKSRIDTYPEYLVHDEIR